MRSTLASRSFTDLVSTKELTFGVAVVGLLLAIVLGCLHALAPGHGKTVMAAYLIGGEGMRAALAQYRDAGSPWPARIVSPVNFDGLFEIGPVDGQTHRILNAPSLPWLVVLPGCDGDVSDLEGVKAAVLGVGTSAHGGKRVERFETVAAGRMKPEEFDAFVRDTVNFLDYAGDPSQVQRRGIGIWVLLFLMVFTTFAWMLKKEYWKDVH